MIMLKTAIIFGGSGYIGSKMLSVFLKDNIFSEYIICDIKKLQGFDNEKNVSFNLIDIREPIELEIANCDKNKSWIFNFAAIHREPGHEYEEYFDTNIPGATNINDFAEATGIQNIFFTSSIAPYGRSYEQRSEGSSLYPETAYGISKGFAELNHQNWLREDDNRRLIIVRPSVIYGPKDPGNVYRMIKSLKKGTFILPNGGNIIKGYGYVYGLIESILFTINKKDRFIVYNYAENPIVPLKDMVTIAKDELGYRKPTLKLPIFSLIILSSILQVVSKILGKKNDIHPVRVKKASFPTNIKPQYLIDNNFTFKYDFKSSLKHWRKKSPDDFI